MSMSMMMMKHVAAIAGVLALLLLLLEPAGGAGLIKFSDHDLRSDKSVWSLYLKWSKFYNVTRKPAERLRRFTTFNETARRVASRVRPAGEPHLRLNIFADVSIEEFSACRCQMLPTDERRNFVTGGPVKREGGNGINPLPLSFDWRNQTCGAGQPCLGRVKSQGRCGACWAFAATAALESHLLIAGADMEDLSEQELLDCDRTSHGCDGGLAYKAFRYVFDHGIASSESYPYTYSNGTCHASSAPRFKMTMRGFRQLPAHDEVELLAEVTYAPVVVSIKVGDKNKDFRDYSGGMYRGQCGTKNDHELLLVGYGPEHYILQNSHGEWWGDSGFLLLPRNQSCGLLDRGASTPELDWD